MKDLVVLPRAAGPLLASETALAQALGCGETVANRAGPSPACWAPGWAASCCSHGVAST